MPCQSRKTLYPSHRTLAEELRRTSLTSFDPRTLLKLHRDRWRAQLLSTAPKLRLCSSAWDLPQALRRCYARDDADSA